jgi:hypothetical protein
MPSTSAWTKLPWARFDRAVCIALALYGAAVFAALLLVPRFYLPAEDAVILHQYSRNLAGHGAITYYAGGPHAEGATDFAWMVLVSGAIRCGITPPVFTAIVNALSLLLLGCVLLRVAGLRITPARLLMVAGAAGLLPQILAAGAGFAVLPDALLLALVVQCFLREQAALTPLAALALCLFRPDGVVFAVPLLAASLFPTSGRAPRAWRILLLFVLPGVAYFLCRAAYFHALFPLPFTVKSDVHRTLGLFVPHSVTTSLKYLFFDAALLAPTLWSRAHAEPFAKKQHLPHHLPLLATLLLGLPTLFYWAMRLDQNVGDRFFYYLPLAAALLLARQWQTTPPATRQVLLRVGLGAFAVFLLGPLLREVRSFRDYQFREVQRIAAALGRLPTRGTLLTTEAGFLAYGSGWVAYDAWGLNTARFADHFIQPADVVALRPDLIVLHPDPNDTCLPQSTWPAAYSGRTWQHMTRNLLLGARDAGGYQLWLLSYGSNWYRERKHWSYGQGDRECLLVSTRSPRAAGIVAALEQNHAVGPPRSYALEAQHGAQETHRGTQ